MKTIIIVDDNNTNLVHAKKALDDTYRTYAVTSAPRMFALLQKIVPDLILLDINMPEMDGMEALTRLKADPKLKLIPVVFLTANNDAYMETRGFDLGAVDFIIKPFSPPVLLKRIEMHIEVDSLIKRSLRAVNDTHNATMSVIANIVERRDQVTGNHIERTQGFMKILIDELVRSGVYADTILNWDLAVLVPSTQLHDVGKIVVSDVILNKPSKLTTEEFEIIKTHADEGENIINEIISKLKDGDSDFLLHAKRIAKTHHERWDGTGYPDGLKGEDIPLEGRLMALVDVYDALVSHDRPYKNPFTHELAVEIILKESGTQFDPKIVEAFVNVADVFWEMAVNSGVQHDVQHNAARGV